MQITRHKIRTTLVLATLSVEIGSDMMSDHEVRRIIRHYHPHGIFNVPHTSFSQVIRTSFNGVTVIKSAKSLRQQVATGLINCHRVRTALAWLGSLQHIVIDAIILARAKHAHFQVINVRVVTILQFVYRLFTKAK